MNRWSKIEPYLGGLDSAAIWQIAPEPKPTSRWPLISFGRPLKPGKSP